MMMLTIPAVPPQIVAWVHSYAARNFWKVDGFIDRDDLIQEGYYSIAYCLKKYGTELDPPHLMRLVQLTFNCAIIDIAKKRTRAAEDHPADYSDDGSDNSFWNSLLGRDNQSQLDRLVAEAPPVVRKALEFLINDYGAMRQTYSMTADGRETTSDRICLSLGIDSDLFIMDKVRSYLKGN